jgi:hypothetical protein
MSLRDASAFAKMHKVAGRTTAAVRPFLYSFQNVTYTVREVRSK